MLKSIAGMLAMSAASLGVLPRIASESAAESRTDRRRGYRKYRHKAIPVIHGESGAKLVKKALKGRLGMATLR